ncbi:hypothetical protein C8Q80DRAFT_1276631 [Daedaleopsis nitida]|nr:hypothetical protein C8Q80DRAFT_1276631 [Daedaleopsis nitida]
MFASLLSLSALAILAAATPTPAQDESCSTGAIQCCQQVVPASSSSVAPVLSAIGVVIQNVDALVGLQCSPITVVGLGQSACSAHTVCCENNSVVISAADDEDFYGRCASRLRFGRVEPARHQKQAHEHGDECRVVPHGRVPAFARKPVVLLRALVVWFEQRQNTTAGATRESTTTAKVPVLAHGLRVIDLIIVASVTQTPIKPPVSSLEIPNERSSSF